MVIRELTVKQWLQNLSVSNTSTEYDERMMQTLCRKCGFPKCRVTCGMVYLDGYGESLAINAVATEILKRQ